MAVDLVGIQTVEHLNRIFLLNNHDFSVSSNFKHAVYALKRTGHARFRRGSPPSSSDPHTPSVSTQLEDNLPTDVTVPPPGDTLAAYNDCSTKKSVTASFQSIKAVTMVTDTTASFQSMNSSFAGGIVAPAPSFSSRKPPLPSSHRKRHSTGTPSDCHCCKRRKTGSKREVRRIPIIGSKVESIPADDYSWRKYGEKKIDGSPFPRVYYKCNSVEGCPARKRVELALTESKMLIVTYDGEHRHRHRQTPTPLPASLNSLQIQSK